MFALLSREGIEQMIHPDQIPDEVVEAALRAYSGNTCECSSCRKAVIRTVAAALSAWPGAFPWKFTGPLEGTGYILPIPQKGDDT